MALQELAQQLQAQAKEQGLELAAGTIAEAKILKKVDKDNVLIKILATLVGLEAITAVLAEGIESLRTNGQLAFARVQYRRVASTLAPVRGAYFGWRGSINAGLVHLARHHVGRLRMLGRRIPWGVPDQPSRRTVPWPDVWRVVKTNRIDAIRTTGWEGTPTAARRSRRSPKSLMIA